MPVMCGRNAVGPMTGQLLVIPAVSPAASCVVGYPPSDGLPIIPRQHNPEGPAIAGWLYYKEWRWSFAGSKTDLYFQELFARQLRCVR
jgi:hypothetical protein